MNKIDQASVNRAGRIAAVLLCCAGLQYAEAREKLLPVDEAASQPDFFTFRAQLQVALVQRDAATVLAAIDPNIRNSFGDDGGIDEFRQTWDLDSPQSRLWETLATVLALGGTFDGDDSFAAPYVYSTWPEEVDSFSFLAILGQGVRVHAEPGSASATIASLNYDIVERGDSNPSEGDWVQVRLPDGTSGYVAGTYARSPLDYRAVFSHAEGQWLLSALVAGD